MYLAHIVAPKNLTEFIVPTKLDNTDEHQESGNKRFQTEDLIYLESHDDVKYRSSELVTYSTDYAVMNDAFLSNQKERFTKRRPCCRYPRFVGEIANANLYGNIDI